jgi:capsular polysaccharide biosynthesis protein
MTRASDARGAGKDADPTDGPRPDQARPGRHDAGNGRSDRVDPGRSAPARGDGGRPPPGRGEDARAGFGASGLDGSSFDDPGFGRADAARGDTSRAGPARHTGTDRQAGADLRWPVVNRAGTARPGAAVPDTGRPGTGRADTRRSDPDRASAAGATTASDADRSSDGSGYPDTKWEQKARAAEAARAAESGRSYEAAPTAGGARTGTDRSTSASGAAEKPAGEASRAGAQPVRSASIGGQASRGTARPATPTAGAVPAGAPPGRAPLPGPPPGMRLPGPPMPPGPRYAAAPQRRMLSGGQRGKLLMLTAALTIIGALLGFVVAAILPSTYAARTTIQYNIAGENTGDFLKTDRNLTTQVVLLTSRSVLQPVADANGVNVDDLTKQVSASILSSSDIIQLQVKNASPGTAVQLANGVAKQYLTVANSGGGRGYLQSQLAGVRKQQSSSSFSATAADTAALATRAAALQAQLDQMNLTQNMSSVLTPAYTLTDPVSPNRSLAGLAGGVSGLVIALMTAVTLARRWTRP